MKVRIFSSMAALCLSAGVGLVSAQAAEPEQRDVTIAVGSQILNYMPLGLTQSLGFFEQEGLNVTVQNFQAGGSKATQALVSGSVDGAVGFYDHPVLFSTQGRAIPCVFLLNDTPGLVFGVRADLADKVKSPADLKGLKVGITTPGSSTDLIARYFASTGGLGPRDVNFIAVGSGAPGMVAMEQKSIDALVYFDPVATLMQRKGTASIVFDARTRAGSEQVFGGAYPTACLYMREEYVDRNPETVQRLANALLRTMQWMDQHSDEEILEQIPAGYKLDDRVLNLEILAASREMFTKTGQFDPEAAKIPVRVLAAYDSKVDPDKIDYSKTYTNRFAEEAARRIAR